MKVFIKRFYKLSKNIKRIFNKFTIFGLIYLFIFVFFRQNKLELEIILLSDFRKAFEILLTASLTIIAVYFTIVIFTLNTISRYYPETIRDFYSKKVRRSPLIPLVIGFVIYLIALLSLEFSVFRYEILLLHLVFVMLVILMITYSYVSFKGYSYKVYYKDKYKINYKILSKRSEYNQQRLRKRIKLLNTQKNSKKLHKTISNKIYKETLSKFDKELVKIYDFVNEFSAIVNDATLYDFDSFKEVIDIIMINFINYKKVSRFLIDDYNMQNIPSKEDMVNYFEINDFRLDLIYSDGFKKNTQSVKYLEYHYYKIIENFLSNCKKLSKNYLISYFNMYMDQIFLKKYSFYVLDPVDVEIILIMIKHNDLSQRNTYYEFYPVLANFSYIIIQDIINIEAFIDSIKSSTEIMNTRFNQIHEYMLDDQKKLKNEFLLNGRLITTPKEFKSKYYTSLMLRVKLYLKKFNNIYTEMNNLVNNKTIFNIRILHLIIETRINLLYKYYTLDEKTSIDYIVGSKIQGNFHEQKIVNDYLSSFDRFDFGTVQKNEEIDFADASYIINYNFQFLEFYTKQENILVSSEFEKKYKIGIQTIQLRIIGIAIDLIKEYSDLHDKILEESGDLLRLIILNFICNKNLILMRHKDLAVLTKSEVDEFRKKIVSILQFRKASSILRKSKYSGYIENLVKRLKQNKNFSSSVDEYEKFIKMSNDEMLKELEVKYIGLL